MRGDRIEDKRVGCFAETPGRCDLPMRDCTVSVDDGRVVPDGVLRGEFA